MARGEENFLVIENVKEIDRQIKVNEQYIVIQK